MFELKKIQSAIARLADALWPPAVHMTYKCGKCTLVAQISGDLPYVLSMLKVIAGHKCSAAGESE